MNHKSIMNRRDFLKLLSLFPLTYYLPAQSSEHIDIDSGSDQKNVLILVFDALSASNMSLFGYRRNTTPQLNELAKKATVYHKHFASGNYTTPGTASLLTGTYPWTHRAIKLNDEVLKSVESRNIFNLFSNYYQFSYTHNNYADTLLRQFHNYLDEKPNIWDLYLSKDRLLSTMTTKDFDAASLVEHLAFDTSNPSTYSLILSRFVKDILERHGEKIYKDYIDFFPRGVPSMTPFAQWYFILEDAIDWLRDQVIYNQKPFLGYVHVLPPHYPYRTRREFIDIFNDGWIPDPKSGPFSVSEVYTEDKAIERRRHYDEFIPYVDSEFNRLFEFLNDSGYFENTIVVFTSDHGEMFERGVIGHGRPFLYQPLVHIPLVVFHPDQNERIDITSPTSAVDVLPTLLHATRQPIPAWIEGKILPPFNRSYHSDRSIFALEAQHNSNQTSPLSQATAMIVRGKYKLTKHFGYEELPEGEPLFELYDLENDPEELNNLYPEKKSMGNELLHELESRIEEADEPYQ